MMFALLLQLSHHLAGNAASFSILIGCSRLAKGKNFIDFDLHSLVYRIQQDVYIFCSRL